MRKDIPEDEHWLTGPARFLAERPGQSQKTHRYLNVHQDAGKLGVGFFCSRDFGGRGNLQAIFPILAFQLACQYPHLRKAVLGLEGVSQFRKGIPLFVDGEAYRLSTSTSVSTPIIINALEEYKDKETVYATSQYPPPLRGLGDTAMFEHATRSASPSMRWMSVHLLLGEVRRPCHSTCEKSR